MKDFTKFINLLCASQVQFFGRLLHWLGGKGVSKMVFYLQELILKKNAIQHTLFSSPLSAHCGTSNIFPFHPNPCYCFCNLNLHDFWFIVLIGKWGIWQQFFNQSSNMLHSSHCTPPHHVWDSNFYASSPYLYHFIIFYVHNYLFIVVLRLIKMA